MELPEHNIDKETHLRISDKTEPKVKIRRFWNEASFVDDLITIKKYKKESQHRQSKLFLSIGLFIGLLAITGLFEWKTYDAASMVELASASETFEELLEIPPTEQPPPPPPKKLVQPNIIEVPEVEEIKEEIQVDFDIDINEDDVMEPVEITTEEPEEEVAEEVFTIVENQPSPKMGMKGFFEYLYKNIKYPRKAIELKVEGKVFVQFIVNTDGTLTDFEVVKGIGSGCDLEAVRVLKEADPWNAGKQRGKPVRVRMILPIRFMLQDY